MLATALESSAARGGFDVAVNRPAVQGEVSVSLGRTRDGRLAMVRQPMPGEGGRVTLNHPDATITDDRLPDGTLSWIEMWVMRDLGLVRDHATRLARMGRSPDAFEPRAVMVNGLAKALFEASGHDLGDVLSGSTWKTSPDGYTVSINHPLLKEDTVFHRHLHVVRMVNAGICIGKGRMFMTDDGLKTRIELHAGRTPPETAVGAAVGRSLADLVSLPGDAGRSCVIEEATTTAAGVILMTARCPMKTLKDGDVN